MRRAVLLAMLTLSFIASQVYGMAEIARFGLVYGGWKKGNATYFREAQIGTTTGITNESFPRPITTPVLYGYFQSGAVWMEFDCFTTAIPYMASELLKKNVSIHVLPLATVDGGIYFLDMSKIGLMAGVSYRVGMSSLLRGWPGGASTSMLDVDVGAGLCAFFVPPVIKDFVTVSTYGTFMLADLSYQGEYPGWGFRNSTLIRITPFPKFKGFAILITPRFEYLNVRTLKTEYRQGYVAKSIDIGINLWPFI